MSWLGSGYVQLFGQFAAWFAWSFLETTLSALDRWVPFFSLWCTKQTLTQFWFFFGVNLGLSAFVVRSSSSKGIGGSSLYQAEFASQSLEPRGLQEGSLGAPRIWGFRNYWERSWEFLMLASKGWS